MSEVKQTALRLLELRGKAKKLETLVRQFSEKNGHEIWSEYSDKSGRMLIASTSYANFDKDNADFFIESANHIESIIKWALEMEKTNKELQTMVKNQIKSLTELTDENESLKAKLEKCREQRDDAIYKRIKQPEHIYFNDKLIDWLDQELESVGK